MDIQKGLIWLALKKSVYAGEAIKTLVKEENVDGVQLAMDLNLSEQMISHIKNNRRKMQQDIAKKSMKVYDNFEYALELINQFTEGLIPPVLRGKNIEKHRLAIEAYAEKELKEALEAIVEICLAKPPESITAEEREGVKKIMYESLDAIAFLLNLLLTLEKDYLISVRKIVQNRIPTWKAWGWIE